MKRIVLLTDQPVLAHGLKAVLAETDLSVEHVCSTLEDLFCHLDSADLFLLETTGAVTLETIARLTSPPARMPVALWIDSVPHEFVSQTISVGVRGIIRKGLSSTMLVKALTEVATGGFWIEKELSERLLFQRPIPLTARERQLVTLLAQGLKNKEIAWALGITVGTVKVYLSRLFQKVGANDRFELALYALKSLSSSPGGELELHPLPWTPHVGQSVPAHFPVPRLASLGRVQHPVVDGPPTRVVS